MLRSAEILVLAILILLGSPAFANAQEEYTKEMVLKDLQARLGAACFPISLGRIHIRPYSEQQRARFITAFEKVGVTVVRNAPTSGNIWEDLGKKMGNEVGEGDLEISLAPGVDMSQVQMAPYPCLRTGITPSNFAIVAMDHSDIKSQDMTIVKVIIVQGTYDNIGTPNSYYAALGREMGFTPIKNAKLRSMYQYDLYKKQWLFAGIDVGDINVSGFRTRNVEEALQRLR